MIGGKATDSKHAIVEYIKAEGRPPDIVICCIPRDKGDFVTYIS